MLKVSLEGGAELDAALAQIQLKVARQILRKAVKVAYTPVFAAVKANLHNVTGQLAASLRIKTRFKASRGTATAEVVTSNDQFNNQGNEFYAAFVEFGHLLGSRKLGNARKAVPGEHFMQYAHEENKEQTIEIFEAQLRAGIEAAAKDVKKLKA